MYRITDRAHTDALIAAAQRGVQVRIVTEQLQYRDESRLWHSWNVDRLWAAGQQILINGQPSIQIRLRGHAGLSHEKLTVLANQRVAILGSSNWTSPSTETQLEHNLFTTDATIYAWSRDHFERKWNNTGSVAETAPFAPQPPHVPELHLSRTRSSQPAAHADVDVERRPVGHTNTISTSAPTWPISSKVLDDRELGPYQPSWTMPPLAPGTVSYLARRVTDDGRPVAFQHDLQFQDDGGGRERSDGRLSHRPTPPPDPVPVPGPQDSKVTTVPVEAPLVVRPAVLRVDRLADTSRGFPQGAHRPADGTFTGERAVPRP